MQILPTELIHSRTCYKHLAGELGVSVTRELLRRGCIENAAVQQKHCFAITAKGRKWCEKHGVDEYLSAGSDGLPKSIGKDITKSCLDHSHRVPHLAGKLGRAILSCMVARHYCQTTNKRGAIVTTQGTLFLREALGIDWSRNHQ